MRERLALWLHKEGWRLINLSDDMLNGKLPTPRPMHDEDRWPTEVDNEDPRNMGESPV
jgi:hypothetical protein